MTASSIAAPPISKPTTSPAPEPAADRPMTLREARAAYFAASGFDESGYTDDWVDVSFGPLPLRFPNVENRKQTIPLHDLHHALTGYSSQPLGEFQIAAWEVGGGMRRHWAGWYLNLSGLVAGLVVSPRAVFRAFVRGRRSENLYQRPLEPELLDEDVTAVRARRGIEDAPAARPSDVAAFAGWSVASLAVGAVALATLPVLVTLGLWGRARTRGTDAIKA